MSMVQGDLVPRNLVVGEWCQSAQHKRLVRRPLHLILIQGLIAEWFLKKVLVTEYERPHISCFSPGNVWPYSDTEVYISRLEPVL